MADNKNIIIGMLIVVNNNNNSCFSSHEANDV